MSSFRPLLQFEDVTRTFGEKASAIHALRGVSFNAGPGEFVAVCGRSGSGKSTILNLACGIDDPTSGRVIVDGAPLGRLSDRRKTLLRRELFGIVFQFFNLIPTLSVLENALLPSYLAGRNSNGTRQRAIQLLSDVGLGGRERDLPEVLSGGEQQRLAIVRAVINEPRIILADEPTGNLDSDNAAFVLEWLARFVKQEDRLVLMVTHSNEALGYASRVLRIRDGRIV